MVELPWLKQLCSDDDDTLGLAAGAGPAVDSFS